MARRHSILTCASLLLIALLPACASIPARTVDAGNPIKTVAVLPFINHTNNVEGPAKLQFHFTAGLYERYYDVVEPDEVNQKLKDQMGVTLGAQLDMAKPDLLCKTFNVDGLLYGSLDDYISKPMGVYTIKRVRAGPSWWIAGTARLSGRAARAANPRRPQAGTWAPWSARSARSDRRSPT